MRISIIGSAGRGSDGAKLNKDVYVKMVNDAAHQCSILRMKCSEKLHREGPNVGQLDITLTQESLHLVSGGAAWADHIAVSLYLMDLADSLTLYFPCKWNQGFGSFKETNKTGEIACFYHYKFSLAMSNRQESSMTMHGIQRAINKGATYHEISGGFKARNLLVGQAHAIIAYTFGEGSVPKDGGTKHTWDHSDAPIKIHRPIGEL